MGTDSDDCRKVAELIGVKTFTNEFIAYGQLKDLINNRKTFENYTTFFNTTQWHWEKDDVVLDLTKQVLKGGYLSVNMTEARGLGEDIGAIWTSSALRFVSFSSSGAWEGLRYFIVALPGSSI